MKFTIENKPITDEILSCVQGMMSYSVYEVYGCNIGITPRKQALELTTLVRGSQSGTLDVITVIDKSGGVIGFAALWRSPCPTYAYLSMLYVHPSCRREGVGSELLAIVKRKYPNISLSALPKEQPFYLAHGFRLGALNPRGDDMEIGDFICPSGWFTHVIHPKDQTLLEFTKMFKELKKLAGQIQQPANQLA